MALRKVTRILGTFMVVAFISVSLFGAMYGIGMQTDAQGKMTGCIFSGTTLCTMTPFEHLSQWQSTFSSIPAESSSALVLLLALAVAYAASAFVSRWRDFDTDWMRTRQRLYELRACAFSYIHPLQEAFSQGLIHSKAY